MTVPKLGNIDKMNYLKSLVEGPATAAIKGLSLTSENYNSARKILEDGYGNKQLIISSQMDNLLKLPVVSSVSDFKGIRQFMTKQKSISEAQQYGSLLVPVFLSKVPQELRLIISREFDTGNWSLDEFLKVFKTEVEARERCNSMATTPSTTPERKHPPKPPPPTFNALLALKGQGIMCTFCKQSHKSVDCVVVANIGERKDILKNKGIA